MTVQEFQKQIRSGDIDRVIILYGEEVAVMDEYLSHLYKAVKVRPTLLDKVSDAYQRLVQRKMTAGSRVIVVRDDMEFFKADKQWGKVFSAAENSGFFHSLCLEQIIKRLSDISCKNGVCKLKSNISNGLVDYAAVDKILHSLFCSTPRRRHIVTNLI